MDEKSSVSQGLVPGGKFGDRILLKFAKLPDRRTYVYGCATVERLRVKASQCLELYKDALAGQRITMGVIRLTAFFTDGKSISIVIFCSHRTNC